nr:hypothetical protein CFP56_65026 [Quercus suber]
MKGLVLYAFIVDDLAISKSSAAIRSDLQRKKRLGMKHLVPTRRPLNKDVRPNNLDGPHDSPRKAHSAELEGRKSADLNKEDEIHTQNRYEGNLKNMMDNSSPPSSSGKDGSDMTSSRLPKPS